MDFIKRYRTVLDQLDEKLDDDFPLWEVIEKFDREREFPEELKEHRAAKADLRPGPYSGHAGASSREPTPATPKLRLRRTQGSPG